MGGGFPAKTTFPKPTPLTPMQKRYPPSLQEDFGDTCRKSSRANGSADLPTPVSGREVAADPRKSHHRAGAWVYTGPWASSPA